MSDGGVLLRLSFLGCIGVCIALLSLVGSLVVVTSRRSGVPRSWLFLPVFICAQLVVGVFAVDKASHYVQEVANDGILGGDVHGHTFDQLSKGVHFPLDVFDGGGGVVPR